MPIPLDLYGEATTASGATFKLDANQPPDSRPQNLSFGTKIGEGFSSGSFQLARRIDQDYRDLNLVDNFTFTGADGSVAYEGRNSAMPRDLSDGHSIGVTMAGWMAHAKDRMFQEVYVDSLTGNWQEMPLNEKAANMAGAVDCASISFVSGDGLTCALPNQALGSKVLAEAWYRTQGDIRIAKIEYKGATTSLPGSWLVMFYWADTDVYSGGSSVTPTLDNTLRQGVAGTPARNVLAYVYSNSSAATPAAGANIRFSVLAAYGNHGLTLHTGDPAGADGVYASDVIRDIASRWCPLLDTSGITATDYVIQQLAFRDAIYPFDAFLQVNKFHLWNLAVWENKRLVFEPYDLTDYDWEIRIDDPGTTFSPQGPSTEDLYNGIAVTYQDPLTGFVDRITPDSNPELADTSVTNPWNAWGIPKWDEITLSAPALENDAVNLGVAALADRNRPRTPGMITVRGYIRDRAGNEQPCWKPRAGETISITNFPNDSPRLIVETDYNDENKSVRLAIDKPFAILEAYLDRQANALQARGLSS